MKTFFKHPIVASVVSALIIGIIIPPLVTDVNSQSFVEVIKELGKFLLNIISVGIPFWLIIILGFIYFTLRKAIRKYVGNSAPEFTSYRADVIEDVIEDVTWEWAWHYFAYRDSYDFARDSPIPFCYGCKGYLIVKREYGGYCLECENCGFDKSLGRLDFKGYQAKIKREILRRVKIEQWKISRD